MQIDVQIEILCRNETKPKDSMIEGYIVKECLMFVLRYFDVVKMREA